MKTCGDTLRKCLIFFYMTRYGASLSKLDELFCAGVAGNSCITCCTCLAPCNLQAVCSPPAAFSLPYCQDEWLQVIIDSECDRHSICSQYASPMAMDRGEEHVLEDMKCAPKGTGSELPHGSPWLFRSSQFPPGELRAGLKGAFESAKVFQEKPWHLNSSFHF